jgi:hypothetical protein
MATGKNKYPSDAANTGPSLACHFLAVFVVVPKRSRAEVLDTSTVRYAAMETRKAALQEAGSRAANDTSIIEVGAPKSPGLGS